MHTLIDPVPGDGVPGWLGPAMVIDKRYRIVEPLGEGGMGMVWVAEHLGLHRRVALKVLQADVAQDPSVLKRFEREAQTLASLAHPNIVALNDYGVWEGTPYLVMELLEGKTLSELLGPGNTLGIDRALDITQQLLRALAYAHARGVIHRDLKPGNVFLQALPDQDDHVKLLDFGFAKFVDSPAATLVTATGMVVGTPTYMAPEAATGAPLDARADVYAAGVLLFEMLTGRRPFEGEPLEILRRRLTEDAPGLIATRPDLGLPVELDHAVAKALARTVADRWQTANEMAAALAVQTAPVTISSTPAVVVARDAPKRSVWPMFAALAVVLAVVGIGWYVAASGSGAQETGDERRQAAGAIAVAPLVLPDPVVPPDLVVPPDPVVPPDLVVPPDPVAPMADPWSADIPARLASLRRMVHRASPPDRGDIRDLREYAQDHREDPRPVLLLAHAFSRMHWMDEALETYARALGMSEASQGDPEVLPNLVTLAASQSTSRGASTLIVDQYGAVAAPVIDATLAAPGLRPEDRERLTALLARITMPEGSTPPEDPR